MRIKRYYRLFLYVLLISDLIILTGEYSFSMLKSLPGSMYVHVGDKADFDFILPIETVIIHNEKPHGDIRYTSPGRYNVDIRLFGLFNIKKVSVDAIEDMSVMPCGSTIGINVDMDGLLVLGTGKIKGADGLEYEPAYQILRTGDYITAINGIKVSTTDGLQKYIEKCEKESVLLNIRRNDAESTISIPIIRCDDSKKRIGVWIREDTQGIGTLTCITKDGSFAALGHGITDSDAGLLLQIEKGDIYDTEILKILKGSAGKPGEIMGMILEYGSGNIGQISRNTTFGIMGKVNRNVRKKEFKYGYMPVGLRKDIKTGPASILCQLGNKIEEYDINIDEVWIGRDDNKGIVLHITDEKLIEKSGGIIQGMSGSPIIQNGKVVGAVTHVFVNDPTKGYGIFIEKMLGNV